METKLNPQDLAQKVPNTPCPAPFSITLDASQPYLDTADFNPAQLTNYQTALNYNKADKAYMHTFVWKPQAKCCQVTKAVLTVKLKALQSGSSPTASTAGNDGIAVMKNGASVPPYSEQVYGGSTAPTNTSNPAGALWPFSAGKEVTKVWDLTGAALSGINVNKRLSFYVQDDTMVVSATLQLSGCCLKIEG